MQNEPNFPHFSPKNACLTQKRSQFEPNSKPNEPNFGQLKPVAKPKRTQFKPNFKSKMLMDLVDLREVIDRMVKVYLREAL
jgi:hypothetical protein